MHNVASPIEELGVDFAARPLITVLGVKYLHMRMKDGSDLYVTQHGHPFTKCLMPENHWADDAWMKEHGARLSGTSGYRVRTKQVEGQSRRSSSSGTG